MVTMVEIEAAIWSGDEDKLHEIAPCRCCCDEHTIETCIARFWGGCKSGLSFGETTSTQIDEEYAYADFYQRTRGWNYEQFFNSPDVQP